MPGNLGRLRCCRRYRLRSSRFRRQKNTSRKSVVERRRARRTDCSGLARAAVIPIMANVFMAVTLTRRTAEAEENWVARTGGLHAA